MFHIRFGIIDVLIVLTSIGVVCGVKSLTDFEAAMSLAFVPGAIGSLRLWQLSSHYAGRKLSGAVVIGALGGALGSAIFGILYLLAIAWDRPEFWRSTTGFVCYILGLRALYQFAIGLFEGALFGALFYAFDRGLVGGKGSANA